MHKPSAHLAILVGLAAFGLLIIAGEILIGAESCADGWASPSIGIQGACSWHGGIDQSGRLLWPIYLLIGIGLTFGIWGVQRRRLQAHLALNAETAPLLITEAVLEMLETSPKM